MDDREVWLTATAVELVGTEAAAFDEAAHARLLVARLADLVAPAEVAVLVADHEHRLTTAAANTHRARDLLALESRFAAGPCTACYESGEPVYGGPVVEPDRRDTSFGRAAERLGYRTCSTLPMRRRNHVVGAVCVLDGADHTLEERDLTLAQLLVDAATIGILQQRALRLSAMTSEQLQVALDSRVVIEQAKGVLAAKLHSAPAVGFDVLRNYARRNNRQLVEVAAQVVRGELSEQDLVTTRRRVS